MGKRRGKQAKKAKQEKEGSALQQPDYVQPVDPPRAVLAVHPAGAAVAVAVGPELRVFDARTGKHHILVSKPEQPVPAAQQPDHAARGTVPFVRSVAFDAAGRFLLAGSEDKAAGLRLWDAASWELLQSIKVPKKVTNCAFTADGRHMLAADKFGDVLAATTERPADLAEGQQQEPEILLGHYCAILTSLSLSAGGRLLATTDRDHRVRVSIVPSDPMQGAHEIQSFCFGHTAFVTCSAFAQHAGQELLVTGGGDGTLRLWEPLQGTVLHTLELPQLPQQPPAEQEGQQQEQQQQAAAEEGPQEGEGQEGGSSGDEDESAAAAAAADGDAGGEPVAVCDREGSAPTGAPVPLALAASPDGRWLVAAVDGRDDLCLLSINWESRQLAEVGWFALPGLHLPASLVFDSSSSLWVVGGPVADASTATFLACGSIAAETGEAQGSGQAALVPAALPDWLPTAAVAALESKQGDEADLLATAAERRRLASQVLQKRKYSLATLEHRKRMRRDKVAAAAAGGKEEEASGEKQGE